MIFRKDRYELLILSLDEMDHVLQDNSPPTDKSILALWDNIQAHMQDTMGPHVSTEVARSMADLTRIKCGHETRGYLRVCKGQAQIILRGQGLVQIAYKSRAHYWLECIPAAARAKKNMVAGLAITGFFTLISLPLP